jgi:hypothetical protein
MSIQHSIDIELNAPYSKQTIEKLLQNGTECGFQYMSKENNRALLNPEELADWFLSFEDNPDLKEDGQGYVRTKIEDTYCALFIDKKDSHVYLYIAGLEIPWEKYFIYSGEDHYYIDFARYIRLLMKMCKGFSIIMLKTEDF